MLKRTITAIVALAVFIPVLIFSHTWAFPIAMVIASLLGCYEMISCAGQKKNLWLCIPIYALAVIFPCLVRYLHIANADKSDALFLLLKLSMGVIFVIALYIFGVAVFNNKKVNITDAGLIFMSCLYIISAFSALVYLRDYIKLGVYIYLLPFICAWTTDIFAYFTGMLFGKHKLIPTVSPKKTVEGALGGIVFCVISTVVFGLIIEKFFSSSMPANANYLPLAISGVLISIVSQVGDLVMSVIKRHYGTKDFGWIFPGHGGILDRFDSVMAISLIMSFICTFFNLFA